MPSQVIAEAMSQQRDRNEELKDKLEDAQRDASRLIAKLSFSEELERIAAYEKKLVEGEASLKRLRGRSYVWRPDLEEKLQQGRNQVAPAQKVAREEASAASRDLRRRVDDLIEEGRSLARRGNFARNEASIEGYEREVDGVEQALDAAEERIKAAVAPLTTPVDELEKALKDLHWTVDQQDSASFKLEPDEHLIACVLASWEDHPEGARKGVLFFTDHRVRFERKEEVATKSFLFFTTEKKKVQELLINEPVGQLVSSDDSTRGWVMKDQLLAFSWAQDARCPKKTTFELEGGTAAEWDKVVELIRSGNLAEFRARGEAKDLAAVRWPSACEGCGAVLPAAVKGQSELVCPYCQQKHRPL
jgi:hypothetical protein